MSLCRFRTANHFVSPSCVAIWVDDSMSEKTIDTVPSFPESFATFGWSSSTAAATASIEVMRAAVASSRPLTTASPPPESRAPDPATAVRRGPLVRAPAPPTTSVPVETTGCTSVPPSRTTSFSVIRVGPSIFIPLTVVPLVLPRSVTTSSAVDQLDLHMAPGHLGVEQQETVAVTADLERGTHRDEEGLPSGLSHLDQRERHLRSPRRSSGVGSWIMCSCREHM